MTRIKLAGKSIIIHVQNFICLSAINSSWVLSIKWNVNFKFQVPAMSVFLLLRRSGLIKSCPSSEDLSAHKISWSLVDWCKFCIHLSSLNIVPSSFFNKRTFHFLGTLVCCVCKDLTWYMNYCNILAYLSVAYLSSTDNTLYIFSQDHHQKKLLFEAVFISSGVSILKSVKYSKTLTAKCHITLPADPCHLFLTLYTSSLCSDWYNKMDSWTEPHVSTDTASQQFATLGTWTFRCRLTFSVKIC
jgi:hypothetical protein